METKTNETAEDDRADLRRFTNRLRIMIGIDPHELAEVGISNPKHHDEFLADPYRFLMRSDENRAGKIFEIIKKRGG